MKEASPPQSAEAIYQQARAATAAGDASAIALCEEILGRSPHPGAMALLGSWRLKQERWPDAIALFNGARKAGHDSAQLLNQLASAHYRTGNLRMAVNALTTALKLEPDNVDSHLNVASVLLEVGQLEVARAHAERAVALAPRRYEALLGMGLLSRAGERSGEAIDWFRQAEGVAPERVDAPMAIGAAYQEMGMPGEALAAFERALCWSPMHSDLHSNRLFTMNFVPEWNPDAWLAAHKQYERNVRLPSRAYPSATAQERHPRCRIGYVSGDFRNHAVARFLLPVLRHHDRALFSVTGYYTARAIDATTREMAACCDALHQVAGLSDQQLVEQIAADAIDILIDCSGHSSGNRLPVFAARAAPVQLTWLGYLGSTGLSAMDYRLTDATADPEGVTDLWHVEKLIRLPRTMWTYEPFAPAPDVTPLPFRRNGHITFGVLSNPSKLSDVALRTWAAIMQALPDSRLMITARDDDAVRSRILAPFREAGIDPARITPLARMSVQGYLEAYGAMDIALDPFPYCGGTTTCDALWQGVPVLGVRSPRPFGMSGATILHQVEMDDWLVDSPDVLVARAVKKAGATGALEALRYGLRERMRESPLMDASGFTRELERVLLQLQSRIDR